MEFQAPQSVASILILDPNEHDRAAVQQVVQRAFPTASIESAPSLEEGRVRMESHDFNIVVCSDALENVSGLELLKELKLRDNEPAVLMVSHANDPKSIAAFYNSGCEQCIVKSEHWIDEIAPALRQVLRMRRLEQENYRLLARLTEANSMLEEKNKRLDDFSATVAHDIRGPLAGISMKLEYVLEAYERQIDAKVAELLRRALGSTGRLTDIVQAMYTFAKLGTEAAKMEAVDMGELVREVVGDIGFNPELDITIGIDQLPTIWGSPSLLRRVLINLLSNAVKYNDKEKIIINVGVLQVMERSLGHYAEIFIEDNGPGIPEDEIKDLFTMFVRGSTSHHDSDGSGIGLSVVQRIVELHHGKIRVDSKVEEGTRFILLLPVERIG